MQDKEVIAARLDLIAAKARVLVNDYRQGRLWDGDLSRGLQELKKEIDQVCVESGSGDSWGR
jgi:hypothetical protein